MKEKTMYAVAVTSDANQFEWIGVYPTETAARTGLQESLEMVKQFIIDSGFDDAQVRTFMDTYHVSYNYYDAAGYNCFYYGEIKEATVYEEDS